MVVYGGEKMFQLANAIMKMSGGFLGYSWQDFEGDEKWGWVYTVVNSIYTILVPILAIVAAAGVIWAIVLGIQMARADSTEKREESKKRLIGLVVGIVIMVVLIVFFTTLFPVIMEGFLPAEALPTE